MAHLFSYSESSQSGDRAAPRHDRSADGRSAGSPEDRVAAAIA
jgi:hypothetical protein